jgi:hypothetical protein
VQPNDLFRGLIERLEGVVREPHEIDLVLAAVPLRNLILDTASVTNLVRRERKQRGLPNPAPHFEVATNPGFEQVAMAMGPSFMAPMDGLSPRMALIEKQILRLNTGEFLKYPALYLEGQAFSIRDVIRQVGYVGGVLHTGSPRDEVQRVLAEWDGRVTIGDVGSVVRGMRSIADVVAYGLRPLIIE